MSAENSTRETQPPETRGRRGWIDVSAARPVWTSQQTGDGVVKLHQPSYSTLIGNHTQHIEWYHVWGPWLASKRVARVCHHQLSFFLLLSLIVIV